MSEEIKYFKVKIEAEVVVQCTEEEILKRIYRDIYEYHDIFINITEKKEITKEEARKHE